MSPVLLISILVDPVTPGSGPLGIVTAFGLHRLTLMWLSALDIPLWAPASVLPFFVAALGLLPPAWHLHGFRRHRHVHFNDDQRQLLLHP